MNRTNSASISRFLAITASLVCLVGVFGVEIFDSAGLVGLLRFNGYALLSLTSFVLCSCLLLYLVSRPARTDERIWLCLYTAGVCLWAGGEMLERFSLLPAGALFWTTLSAIGVTILPTAIYLFTLSYTNQSDRRYAGTTTVLLVTSFIVSFFYAFTSLIFNIDPTALKLYPWGFNNDPGSALPFTLGWLDCIFALSLARMGSFRRRTRNAVLRKQSLIFIIAIIIPLVGGTLTDGILPILGVNSVPPAAMLLSSVTSILLVFGALRYHFLTISPSLFSETILSIMHESVVVTDDAFRIIYMNPEAQALLGVGTDERGQLSLLSFIRNAAMLKEFKQAFAGADANGSTVSIEHIDVARGASATTPVKVTSSRFVADDFHAHVVVLTDITRELRSKAIIEHTVQMRTEELHQARAYLVASINSLGQGFILVNRQADVALTNHTAEQLVRRSGGDVAKQHLADAVGGMNWDIKLADVVVQVLESKRPKQVHTSTPDGWFYNIYITPVLSEAEVLGAAVVIEDVTEQRILERSKEEFFSIASHELRTPLTAIRGNMDMMVEMHGPELMKVSPKVYEMANDVHTASVRLIGIVNDFLDSSRLEQGKMKFTLEPTPVKPAVEAVVTSLKLLMKEQHDKLIFEGLDDLPPVQADGERLKQILYNVIHNAIIYTEHGTVAVAGEVRGKNVRIEVRDSGQGIQPQNQKLLFHKFQQAGSNILTRETSKGTGLGLYISRLLARHMRGDVELASSEVGGGSVFAITLPKAKS
jgi:signal transduction histidine kinase